MHGSSKAQHFQVSSPSMYSCGELRKISIAAELPLWTPRREPLLAWIGTVSLQGLTDTGRLPLLFALLVLPLEAPHAPRPERLLPEKGLVKEAHSSKLCRVDRLSAEVFLRPMPRLPKALVL